jgi:hypothetical protein
MAKAGLKFECSLGLSCANNTSGRLEKNAVDTQHVYFQDTFKFSSLINIQWV